MLIFPVWEKITLFLFPCPAGPPCENRRTEGFLAHHRYQQLIFDPIVNLPADTYKTVQTHNVTLVTVSEGDSLTQEYK